MAYNKHTWETNELITDILLNNIEDGIAAATTTADNAVPKTLTINGKALSANITLDAADVGAVPTSRTVNGNALSADLTLGAADVGAVAKSGDTMEGRLYAPGYTTTATNGYPNVYFQNSGAATGFVANEASTRRFMFNEYPSDSSTYYESFMIPAPSQGLTQNNFYSILTTKSPVTVAQGGTNATTIEGARTTLDVYSKSEVDALVTGGATPSGDYLPISGGTLSGNLYLNFTNAHLRVGSTDGSAGVSIYHSSEGGNINIKSPNGTTWEMDAYSNTFFRLYYNAGAPSWLFMNDGSFKIQGVQTPYIALQSNIVDITSSTNNITGNALNPALTWLDKNGTATCGLTNVLSADGSNAFYIYIQNRDGSGNTSGLRGIKYTLSNANVGSWVISDPAAFRSALSIGSVTDSNVWLVNTSRTANTVLAAPNGSAGSASFRALVAADIPALAASKITSGTLGVARGGTGAASFTANSVIISGSSTTAALTTRTIRNNTSKSNCGYTNTTGDGLYIPTVNTLAFWDGSYDSSHHSNITYTAVGELKDMATKSSSDYWAVSASRTANTVLAAPSGSNGTASFRKLVAADIPALSYLSTNGGTLNGAVGFKSGISVTALNTTASGDFITVRDNNNTAFGYIKGATGGNVLRMSLGIYNTSSVFSEFSICLNSSNVPYCTIAGYEMWSKRTMYYSSSVPAASSGSNGDICFVPA